MRLRLRRQKKGRGCEMTEELEGAIEAILFAMGEAVELSRIADAIGRDPANTEELLRRMQASMQCSRRGVTLMELDGSWQLCTKKEYYEYLIRIVRKPRKAALTDVLLETLAIIAYQQPVTKAQIEKIRGVKSDHAVNKLVEYQLVRELGRMDAPGRPILFGTTEEFLRDFGLVDLGDLPQLSAVQMADYQAEAEQELLSKEQEEE